jgi:hypothetical protein
MKMKLLMSLLFYVALLSVNAQFRKIPAVVTDSFKVHFPNADHVNWKDKLESFQAEFKSGPDDVKANFSSKGEWQHTEKKFAFDKLPSEVKDGFKKSKFANYAVKEVMEIDDYKDGHEFKLTVKKGNVTKRNLFFTPQGQLTSDSVAL